MNARAWLVSCCTLLQLQPERWRFARLRPPPRVPRFPASRRPRCCQGATVNLAPAKSTSPPPPRARRFSASRHPLLRTKRWCQARPRLPTRVPCCPASRRPRCCQNINPSITSVTVARPALHGEPPPPAAVKELSLREGFATCPELPSKSLPTAATRVLRWDAWPHRCSQGSALPSTACYRCATRATLVVATPAARNSIPNNKGLLYGERFGGRPSWCMPNSDARKAVAGR